MIRNPDLWVMERVLCRLRAQDGFAKVQYRCDRTIEQPIIRSISISSCRVEPTLAGHKYLSKKEPLKR